MNIHETYQGTLFEDCSIQCEAYAACGGRRITAPCGCVWHPESEKRYKCNECYIICRERISFHDEIENGYTLDQVSISQKSIRLPTYVPLHTHDKNLSAGFFSSCIAVDVRNLFNCYKSKGAILKRKFATESAVREHFHVTDTCKLVAVLNGEDWMLESLWAMPRKSMLHQLASVGFTICTAPTFSISELTTEGTLVPYSHHTAMLMRHHRVLSEISAAGLIAVPNLYWLDGDKRELNRWKDWLTNNQGISILSKDFTSIRDTYTINSRISEFIDMLNGVGRSFHILIIGTGPRNASLIVKRLTSLGHKVSVITSAPIMKAIHGSEYVIDLNGNLSEQVSNQFEQSFKSLISNNVSLFDQYLTSCKAS